MSIKSDQLEDMFAPPVNRAMHVLDRAFFSKTVPLAAAVILDKSQIHPTRQKLRPEVLDIGKVSSIVEDPHSQHKALLLKPHVQHKDKATWSGHLNELVEQRKVSVVPYDLELSYANWTYLDILRAIIPVQDEIPTGFSMTGHVAHLNLRSQYLPYKHLIATVLMDKNPSVRTVINKIDDVGSKSVFRTFKYELLVGDPSLDVEVREQDCMFRFNFAEVYWNSRLHTEHERLVAKFQPGDAVCDLMAGVGPFAIPAGRKKIFVWANDLNPASYRGLVDAIKINHVSQFVKASNTDAREFVRASAMALLEEELQVDVSPKVKKVSRSAIPPKSQAPQVWLKQPKTFDHYVMNLPASAITFLDAFVGLYHGREYLFAPQTSRRLPMIHVYCFGPKIEDMKKIEGEICADISERLGYDMGRDEEDLEIYDVRDVAPLKRMFCVSFRLPAEVAFRDVQAANP